jgi:N-acetylglucosaminyl-diphospho-decaprenol L-rhamnosyltransferase
MSVSVLELGDRAAAGSELAIIINSYNRRALLERSVRSLYRHLDPLPAEVVVVDDGSTDGSDTLVREWIRSGQFPGLALLQAPTRLMFAGGVNFGILNTRAPYVCLFETDNVANDAGMWRAVDHLKAHPNVAAVGFHVTTMQGESAGNSMTFPSALGFVLGQQLTARLGLERPGPGPRRDVVFTSPLVLSRAAISRFGLMNAVDFPFCDSDIDWCRRMRDAGFELHVLDDVKVVHDQGDQKSEFSLRRTLDFHRARLAYFRRYAPSLAPVIKLGLLARHLGELSALRIGQALGNVDDKRVRTRRELLRLWRTEYRETRPRGEA